MAVLVVRPSVRWLVGSLGSLGSLVGWLVGLFVCLFVCWLVG